MDLYLRILKFVHPDNGGPRPRRLLELLARTPREKKHAEKIVSQLIANGVLVKYGDRKGAKYGLPGGKA